MKTLILGHGRKYSLEDVRCSYYPVENWYNTEYMCVDIDENVSPDIIFDLKKTDWTFCEENEYDLIVDTCGLALFLIRGYSPFFRKNILKSLNEGGKFYGWKKTVWTKINGELISL